MLQGAHFLQTTPWRQNVNSSAHCSGHSHITAKETRFYIFIVNVCHCLVIVCIQYLALSIFTECIYVRLETPSGPQLPCVGGRDVLADHNYSLKDFLILWTLFDFMLPTYVNVLFLQIAWLPNASAVFMIDTNDHIEPETSFDSGHICMTGVSLCHWDISNKLSIWH